MLDPAFVARWVLALAAFGQLLSAAEQLFAARRGYGTVLNRWDILRLRRGLLAGRFGDVLTPVLADRAMPRLWGARALAAGWLLAAVVLGVQWLWPLLALVVVNAALALRSPYGTDGADQMMHLILWALLLGGLAGTAQGLAMALWFIAVQSVLSYLISGAAKLISPDWRSGVALRGVFATRIYGHGGFHRLLAGHPRFAQLASLAVIVAQLSAPLWVLAGLPGAVIYCVIFAAFHLANALLMGLAWFAISFPAAYPAVIFLALSLAR